MQAAQEKCCGVCGGEEFSGVRCGGDEFDTAIGAKEISLES